MVVQAPHRQRGRFGLSAGIFLVGVVAVVLAVWIVTAVLGIGPNASTIRVEARIAATSHSVVGGDSGFTVTVTNPGRDIEDFVIYARGEGSDDWFRHHSITESGSCRVESSRGRFACGPIAKGSIQTFTIQGRALDAGKFNYRLNYADDRGGKLAWASQDFRSQNYWSEVVVR